MHYYLSAVSSKLQLSGFSYQNRHDNHKFIESQMYHTLDIPQYTDNVLYPAPSLHDIVIYAVNT